MKKLLSLALVTSLLLGTTSMEAKHHSHNHGSKPLSGAWQIVKIGGGIFMIGFGGAISISVCAAGCGLKCCQPNCLPVLGCFWSDDEVDSCHRGGNQALLGGVVIGSGSIYCGYRSIKSGLHGLKKLAGKKKHKKKKYKHHHPMIHN